MSGHVAEFQNNSSSSKSTSRMTNRDRELIFIVADQDARLFLTISHWWKMKRFREIMAWLIENKLTGKTLWAWLQIPPHDGIFNSAGFILGRINKDRQVHMIRAGTDYM